MFRPCIDLHEGKVKHIVGGTLGEDAAALRTNFQTDRPASWFAELYRRDGLRGGHVIMLGPGNDAAARAASPPIRADYRSGAGSGRTTRASGSINIIGIILLEKLMSLDDAIKKMTDVVKSVSTGAEVKTVKMSDEEARLSVYAPAGDIQASRMRPSSLPSTC